MRYLFTSGTARGGTNLRTFMLDQHPEISMAIDPFIPLFRYYRDCILRYYGKGHLLEHMPSNSLDDYYFSDQKIETMQLLQEVDPDIPFDWSQWPGVKNSLYSRLSLTSKNLIHHLDNLPAPTFKEVFENCLNAVAARKKGPLKWVGFNDNWTAEFFPLLARLFPDAKFILHLRDPRAVVNSSEFAEPDCRKRPTVLSFSRHIRKYIALSQTLPQNPILKDRLLITKYEPFLDNPEDQIKRLVNFLNVNYIPEMGDVMRFGRGDGALVNTPWNIYKSSGDIWRQEMPKDMLELVEFICTPEMKLHGYEPEIYNDKNGISVEAFLFAIQNAQECIGWRTDFSEIERTLGCELFRKLALSTGVELSCRDINRNFLNKYVYEVIKKQ